MAELLLYDDNWIDFHLIGVNTNFTTSTQFIFNLNSTFYTRFQRIKDLDICLDDYIYYFETYEWFDTINKIDYHIINNTPNQSDYQKNEVDLSNLFEEKVILIPNYRDCNYIVKISGWEGDLYSLPNLFIENDFINLIRKIEIDSISVADRLVF